MKTNHLFVGLAALSLTACATADPVPQTRPLTPEARAKLGSTPVIMGEMGGGVGIGWNSAMAAPVNNDITQAAINNAIISGASPMAAGIGGGLGQVIAAAIIDAVPGARARRNSDALNTVVDTERLEESLKTHIGQALAEVEGVDFDDPQFVLRDRDFRKAADALKLDTSYVLSVDGTSLRVDTHATIDAPDVPYETVYNFEKSVPSAETKGPVYRNRFVYVSDRLSTPVMTPELRSELIARINDSYTGELDSKAEKAKKKELEDALDDKLSKSEASMFEVRDWAADDGARLYAAIEEAHAFTAKMLAADLKSSTVPDFNGLQDEVISESGNRIVMKVGAGNFAGAYVSEPEYSRGSTPPVFGNAAKYKKDP